MQFLKRIGSALYKIFFLVSGVALTLSAVVLLADSSPSQRIFMPILLGCFGLALIGEAVNVRRMVKFYLYAKRAIFFLLIISLGAFLIDAVLGTSLYESFKALVRQL